MKHLLALGGVIAFLPVLFPASAQNSVLEKDALPAAPDYADPSMWYESMEDQDGTGADVFYICSTSTSDWTDPATGRKMHYADVFNPEHRARLLNEMKGIDRRIDGCNLYIPYYRQATFEGLLEDTSRFKERCTTACNDINRAFRYFLDHRDGSRPFVIMGYSQGGFCVVELLRQLSREESLQMVAAYVIGYQVTQEDLHYPFVIPARGEGDTGVTVCYNTVRTPGDGISVISGDTAVGINPVNWMTDATPAVLCDTLTAVLDPSTFLTCVSGYEGETPMIPYIGVEGNYHSKEIVFYGPILNRNIHVRTEAWRRRQPSCCR